MISKKSALLGAALSGFLATATACKTASPQSESVPSVATGAEEALGECHGINACKGKGECGGKGYGCAGNNSCKGEGWLRITEKDCKKKHGKFVAN